MFKNKLLNQHIFERMTLGILVDVLVAKTAIEGIGLIGEVSDFKCNSMYIKGSL